ncbi:MAG TPA: DNA repair protein RecN [Clostridiales bacterium]|nr:DNA repair protein RecN [Clostridiales bacterium]
MLRRLAIQSFAIIERVEIDVELGFNVLTGETGAGKSILIDAVEVALGGRASSDYVRSGSEQAAVEATFDLRALPAASQCLAALGAVSRVDHLLTLSREITTAGRSTGRINGRVASAGSIREVTQHLVDLHGQHEHQSLLRQERHRDFLDSFGGGAVQSQRRRVEAAHAHLQRIKAEMEALAGDAGQRERQLDLLRFQVEEIDRAALRPGEAAAIEEERRILGSIERLRSLLGGAYSCMTEPGEGPSLGELASQVAAAVGEAARIDPGLEQLNRALGDISYQVQDSTRDLRQYLERLQPDPARLAELERRLDLLANLGRKYGPTSEDVLAFRERASRELDRIVAGESTIRRLQAEREQICGELGDLAGSLSSLRAGVSRDLERRMEEQLRDLAMEAVVFRVSIEQEEDAAGVPVAGTRLACSARGVDRVEFLISPNPGEPARPLARIASGGELSRIMLALKALVAEADAVPTVIFDEIDVGVGGSAALAVGRKLALVAAGRQVMCVTHLAPIACFADTHLRIFKEVRGGRTVTLVERLDGAGRVDEIARMLAGTQQSPITRRHAEAMLADAAGWRAIARGGKPE